MTHIVLPRMLERGRGAIINVSSSLSQVPPTPLLAAYTASMAYVHTLSTTLHEECRRKGVIIQVGVADTVLVAIVGIDTATLSSGVQGPHLFGATRP